MAARAGVRGMCPGGLSLAGKLAENCPSAGGIQNLAVNGDGDHLPGKELAAVLQGGDGGVLQPAAAGDLHAHHGQAFHLVFAKDLGELFGVVHTVQLGAADQAHPALQKLLVKIAVGVGSAVGGHQQVGTVQPGGIYRGQLDLYWPLAQLAGQHRAFAQRRRGGGPVQATRRAAGAAVGALGGHAGLDGRLVKGGSLPLHKGDGPLGNVPPPT